MCNLHKPCLMQKFGKLYSIQVLTITIAIFAIGIFTNAAAFGADNTLSAKLPHKYTQSGVIKYCSTFTNPPREYYADGKPTGADVDIAKAVADIMNLDISWVRVKFASLIPALQAKQCDMIVEELYIKPKRKEVINLLPFSRSAEQAVVQKGNPHNIHNLDDMSGQTVAVSNGTTFYQILREKNKELKSRGKPEINFLVMPSTASMYNQVISGTAVAAGGTNTSAAYYIQKTNGRLELAGKPFHPILDGFGFRKADTQLFNATKSALVKLIKSKKYKNILAKYNISSAAITTQKVLASQPEPN